MIGHWLLTQSPAPPPPQRSGGETESSNPLITKLIPLATSPHLVTQGLTKSQLIDITKDIFMMVIT